MKRKTNKNGNVLYFPQINTPKNSITFAACVVIKCRTFSFSALFMARQLRFLKHHGIKLHSFLHFVMLLSKCLTSSAFTITASLQNLKKLCFIKSNHVF